MKMQVVKEFSVAFNSMRFSLYRDYTFISSFNSLESALSVIESMKVRLIVHEEVI